MEQCLEEQPRYMGADFGEFMRCMKVLSGESLAEIGTALGVGKNTVSLYMRGDIIPNEERQQVVKEIFALSNIELDSIFPKSTVEPLSPEERRARGENLGSTFTEIFGAMKLLSGRTNKDMAAALDVKEESVRKYLHGRLKPSPVVQQKIRDIFSLNDDEFYSIFPKSTVEPLNPEERRARGEYLGSTFAEFLSAMKYLSGKINKAMAADLGVSTETVRRYLIGRIKPSPVVQQKVKDIFGLNDTELDIFFGVTMIPSLSPEERRERNEFLGLDLAEFFGAMKFLSGKSNEAMAAGLGVSLATFNRYLSGTSSPSAASQLKIKITFGLNNVEMNSLLMEPSGKSLRRDKKLQMYIASAGWESFANCKGVKIGIFYTEDKAKILKAKKYMSWLCCCKGLRGVCIRTP